MQSPVANATPATAPRTVKSLDGVDRTFKPRPEPEPVTAELESDLQIANDTPHVYGLDPFQTRTGSITALHAWAARDPLDRMGNFPNHRSTRTGCTHQVVDIDLVPPSSPRLRGRHPC